MARLNRLDDEIFEKISKFHTDLVGLIFSWSQILKVLLIDVFLSSILVVKDLMDRKLIWSHEQLKDWQFEPTTLSIGHSISFLCSRQASGCPFGGSFLTHRWNHYIHKHVELLAFSHFCRHLKFAFASLNSSRACHHLNHLSF